jgi:NAD(P)-dependent dehydrogenase (short-subunit alcohol dehydrogenase family)
VSGRLAGKVAFITGAARGQGRAHAVRMAAEGADILAVDVAASCRHAFRTARPLPTTSPKRSDGSKTPAVGFSFLSSTQGISTDFGELSTTASPPLGRLDIIVANAAIAAPQVWSDITPEDFRDVIDVNVTGTWNTVMAGAQKIVDGGRGGSIILISSAAGIKVQPFMVHYTASKHAVTGMARAFAAELGRYSIRVNSVHPGPVNTPMGSGEMVDTVMKATETNPQLANMLTPFLPNWVAQPDDIADAVLWLASDESKNVTAARISVDQGSTQY